MPCHDVGVLVTTIVKRLREENDGNFLSSNQKTKNWSKNLFHKKRPPRLESNLRTSAPTTDHLIQCATDFLLENLQVVCFSEVCTAIQVYIYIPIDKSNQSIVFRFFTGRRRRVSLFFIQQSNRRKKYALFVVLCIKSEMSFQNSWGFQKSHCRAAMERLPMNDPLTIVFSNSEWCSRFIQTLIKLYCEKAAILQQ